MNENGCPLETKVLEALDGGTLDGELAAHAQNCHACRHALLVHRWMEEFRKESAAADLGEMSLPDPEILWNRATSHFPDEAVVRKVLGPLRYYRTAAFAALALLMLAIFTPLGGVLSSIPGWEALASSLKSVAKGAVQPFFVVTLPAVLGLPPLLLLVFVVRFKPIRD
jgi:hypothetical protein